MFNRYKMPPWLRRCRDGIEIIILPIGIFQFVRTLLLPTTFDVILLCFLILIYLCFFNRWF